MLTTISQETSRLPLRRESLNTKGSIFLVDAYVVLSVHYRESASVFSFPPQRGTLLRQLLHKIKNERKIEPLLQFTQEGQDSKNPLSSFLLDEANVKVRGFLITQTMQ